MDQLKSLLVSLRILDPDGSLSLTSIVLMAATVKFMATPGCDTTTLLALLGALTAHQGKKLIGQRAPKEESSELLASLGTQVQALKTEMTVIANRTDPRNQVRR